LTDPNRPLRPSWHRGLALRHLDAPHFLATKFEAFNDRGEGDVYVSHDLEDILTVVDGRDELADELARADATVRGHVTAQVHALLACKPA
jgi:hypothetical protein